jgi:ADP-L-glycero-D-manno-heptose 6-epimerase
MIIVTGANGFIGSAFVWELNQAGIKDILAVDSVSPADRPDLLKKSRFTQFLSKDELWDFLASPAAAQKVEWIVHMGACSSTTELNIEFLRENNTQYTQRLWEWCTTHQKSFIYASSGAIYGAGDKGFDDAAPPELFHPLNPYGDSKLNFDIWAVKQKQTPPNWYGLRFFNVYGPNEYHKGDMSSVVFKAYQQIQEHGSLKLFRSHRPDYKDGEQLRDFIYVKDITRWMAELREKTPTSGIYNMGFGKARTWLDLAKATFQNLHRVLKIDWIDIPIEMRPRYQYFTEAKMVRLSALGLSKPQWSLEDGVKDYVTNYLSKPDRYL